MGDAAGRHLADRRGLRRREPRVGSRHGEGGAPAGGHPASLDHPPERQLGAARLLQLRHGPIGDGMRIRCLTLVFSLSVMLTSAVARAEQQWLTLPPTPTLPKAEQSGYAPINGIKIWYATFGKGELVLLLHGGLANSNYWGNQVPALARNYRVIVMDSRGHGRSTHDDRPYGYDLMASDVIGLMDFLKLSKAAIVGWSDGAIIGLDIAIHHPERVSRLFAFAANSDPSGVADIAQSSVFKAYIARTEKE